VTAKKIMPPTSPVSFRSVAVWPCARCEVHRCMLKLMLKLLLLRSEYGRLWPTRNVPLVPPSVVRRAPALCVYRFRVPSLACIGRFSYLKPSPLLFEL
jgi:hypothetical protein